MHAIARVLSAERPMSGPLLDRGAHGVTGCGARGPPTRAEAYAADQALSSRSNRTGEAQRDRQPMMTTLTTIRDQGAERGGTKEATKIGQKAADPAQRSDLASKIRLRKQELLGTGETTGAPPARRATSPNERLCDKMRSKNASPSGIHNIANIKTVHQAGHHGSLSLHQSQAWRAVGRDANQVSPNMPAIRLDEIDVYNSNSELK